MQTELIDEARRQAQICNACRYCEGYCAVFPAMHAERAFSDGDLTQLANLCHNCRGCYYACQYTAPHEFDLNLPQALAELRQDSWRSYAWPAGFGRLVDRSGLAIAVGLVLAFALLFALAQGLRRIRILKGQILDVLGQYVQRRGGTVCTLGTGGCFFRSFRLFRLLGHNRPLMFQVER